MRNINIVIVGAGTHGNMILNTINNTINDYSVIGFIDDNLKLYNNYINNVPVLGDFSSLAQLIEKYNIDGIIIGISDAHMKKRREYYNRALAFNLTFINVIDSTAIIKENVNLGNGIYIGAGAIVSTGAKIGNNVVVYTGSTIEHDNYIGDNVWIGPGVHLSGSNIINNNTLIGTGSTIIPRVSVGNGVIIGAGTVIIEDVPNNVLIVGNPGIIKKSYIIPHSKPSLDSSDYNAIKYAMGSGYIAQGAMVAEFEEKYSNYLGIYGAIATNSGTSALHLALLSLDIKRGDEVILPTYVCTSLLNAINYVNATPIFVDIDSNDYNLNPQILDNYITKRTKAIIIPHMFGKCADLDEIIKYDIPIIEDCAQSLGAKYKGKKAGSMGLLSICSFYATKMITTGEGGIVASNDEHLLEKMRDLRDYDFKQRYITRYNYKMTDMQASMGINQLKKLSCFISRRKYVAECYNKILTNSSNIKTPAYDNERVYYRYIIQIKKNLESIENYFLDNNIMCRRSINGLLHKYANTPGNFPNAEYAISNTLSIPIYPSLSNEDLEKITIVLKDVAQFGDNYV